jgi:hypothetical protein
MDHCLLQVSTGMLGLTTPRKKAHLAGQAGAVMDGGGLKVSYGAGRRQVGFAAATNLLRQARSCARRLLLNQPPYRSILRLFSSLRCGISRSKSLAGSRPQVDAIDGSRRAASPANDWKREATALGFAKPRLRSRAPGWRADQVSARNELGKLTTFAPLTSTPPTNPHLEALGLPFSGTCRGLSVCRRENWRHGSRAHRRLLFGSPRIARAGRRQSLGGAGTSRARPSHLCGGGNPLCHEPLSVLLLRLLLSRRLFGTKTFEAPREEEHGRPRLRGPCSSIRIGTIAINDGRRDARDEPVNFRRALRGKQSRTRSWTVPQPRAGDTAHGTI